MYVPSYGDLSELNTRGAILEAVGRETLREIAEDSIHLIDTSVAVYEENGDYAFGMLSSGWCRLMDRASRALCEPEDNRHALESGKWLCHENCWKYSAKEAIRTGGSTDIACVGGIRLYAEPIFAEGKAIGAINIGYGSPPSDPATLKELSMKFKTDEASLHAAALQYQERPSFIISAAKRRLSVLARLIGSIVEKHLLEKAALAERKRLDLILSSLDTGLSLINRDMTIAWVNKKTQAMFPEKQAVGSVCHSFFEDRSLPCDGCPTREAFETGKIVRADRFNEKSKRWFHVISQPVKDRDGKVLQVLEGITDITEKKASEEAFQANTRFLNTLLETLPIPVFYKDRQGRYLGGNKAFEDFLGRPLEQIAGKTVFETSPREIAELYHQKDEELFRNPGKQTYEWKVRPRDGEARHVVFHKAALVDESGEVKGLVGGILDITERKEFEIALRRSEEHYRTLSDSIRDAILVTDTERNIIHCNPAFEELFEYTLEKIRGSKTVRIYASEEEFQQMGEAIRGNVGNPQFLSTVHYKKKSGEVFPGETNVFYLKDDHGGVAGFIGLIRDITEKRRAEEERNRMEARLRQAHKMEAVGRLAGGVAHDFNNMLNVILGYADMALSRSGPGTPVHGHLLEIKQAAERSSDLVRQLLAFSRKQMVLPRIVNLNQAIEDHLKMIERLIGEDIEVRFIPAQDPWEVWIDEAQLHQTLTSLSVNARDAMPGGGEVVIETANATLDESFTKRHVYAAPGDYVLLGFSDTGRGMDEKTLEQIFEPFFTTKEGAGLGLATVYGIVKQNNGIIHASSEPGKGSAIRIYLPRYRGAEPGEPEPAKEPEGAGFPGTGTVLVVSDEAQIRNLARKILEQEGYAVLAAGRPDEAARMTREHEGDIHLLLTDGIMHGMSGMELREEIEKRNPGIKTLFLSGHAADAIADKGLETKGVELLRKPFTMDELIRKVSQVMNA